MHVRPLQFTVIYDAPTRESGYQWTTRPRYGNAEYLTGCGRFAIYRTRRHWNIRYYEAAWCGWIGDNRLSEVAFATRRDALEALEQALNEDGMMNAQRPTHRR